MLKKENVKNDLKTTIIGVLFLVVSALGTFGKLTNDQVLELQGLIPEAVNAIAGIIMIFGNMKKTS